MPMTIVERNELSTSKSSDWSTAATALSCKQLSKTLGAVRLVLFRRELLSSQQLRAVRARETIAMPRSVLVSYSTLVDHPVALQTALSILFLVARNAHNFLVTWDETLDSDWLQAGLAGKALLVPLLASVFVLLHTCSEQSGASVAFGGIVVVMAVGAEESLVLVSERAIDQRHLTIAALEASLMPMLLLVRQILRVGSDGSLALFADIGEVRLIAIDAERLLIAEDVTVSSKIQLTIGARVRLTSRHCVHHGSLKSERI